MPLEIEVKLKVEGHEGVLAKLKALGAVHVGKVREKNIFFDRNGGELRKEDRGLRVRLTEAGGAGGKALVTLKGPAGKTGLRSREAFDVFCEPVEQVIPLLEALGFERVMSFEKDRDSWEVEGCKVELDTLPHFGKFLEVEGPSEEAVKAVQGKLGLGGLQAVRESYSAMVGNFLRERGEMKLEF
ncbi:MAG TPA: class IV adenylate cyclase [Phycisphaerae bacterium]|nr:class IV adenylate cyclase [Phycisphaerae bacterium]